MVIGVVALAVVWGIVRIERGQRRITVNYAKRQQGRTGYAQQTSHLPLKINMSGVIPAIFASSILLFPASIAQWAGDRKSTRLNSSHVAISYAVFCLKKKKELE